MSATIIWISCTLALRSPGLIRFHPFRVLPQQNAHKKSTKWSGRNPWVPRMPYFPAKTGCVVQPPFPKMSPNLPFSSQCLLPVKLDARKTGSIQAVRIFTFFLFLQKIGLLQAEINRISPTVSLIGSIGWIGLSGWFGWLVDWDWLVWLAGLVG